MNFKDFKKVPVFELRHTEQACFETADYFTMYFDSAFVFLFSVLSSEQPQDEDIILLLTHEAYYVAR